MTDDSLRNPSERVRELDELEVPFVILGFDALGHCQDVTRRDEIVRRVNSGEFTDVFVFSHGWNNDWHDVTTGYDKFIEGFRRLRRENPWTSAEAAYQPVLIGIFWPSIILVLPHERRPSHAGIGGQTGQKDETTKTIERSELDDLALAVGPDHRERFLTLAGFDEAKWGRDQAEELARILAPVYAAIQDDDIPGSAPLSQPDELLKAWRAPSDDPGSGIATTVKGRATGAARHAGNVSYLKPRQIIRGTTVRRMKDRAKVVGGVGVGDLLGKLLTGAPVRVHLIGHSYGCQVVLSAVCSENATTERKIESALLLQPAISAWCFAPQVHDTGKPGGYEPALSLIRQPILTTFSVNDKPLRRYYHLALDRRGDAGERRIAPGIVPYYAALGGYGPRGLAESVAKPVPMCLPPETYVDLTAPNLRVLALDGKGYVADHGDISSPATYWALEQQVRMGLEQNRNSGA
jgi:hypothetical protein